LEDIGRSKKIQIRPLVFPNEENNLLINLDEYAEKNLKIITPNTLGVFLVGILIIRTTPENRKK